MLLFELTHPTLRVGVVTAERVLAASSSSALLAEVERREQQVRTLAAPELAYPESVRAAVRDALRVGGYKPTGRGKPASELLLALAKKDGLPRIGNLVEINNLASLESGLPISIFDAHKLGSELAIRFGKAGEEYVFNASGHSMSLTGLPVVCRGREREPVGNAVRDSMLCKVDAQTQRVVAMIYGSQTLPEHTLEQTAQRLAELLRTHASAAGVGITLLP